MKLLNSNIYESEIRGIVHYFLVIRQQQVIRHKKSSSRGQRSKWRNSPVVYLLTMIRIKFYRWQNSILKQQPIIIRANLLT